MHALSSDKLDAIEEDLVVIRRYLREPHRDPHVSTMDAFRRASTELVRLVDGARVHLTRCVEMGPTTGSGYWITCRSIAPMFLCDDEWLSHDLLTAERLHRHMADQHHYPEHLAFTTVQNLRQQGLIP